MSAPSKVHKIQSVKIRPTQRLTTSIEQTITLCEATSMMKLIARIYQAATKVKVLSPEIFNIIEADVFHCAEGSMKGSDMVSYHSLYRGPRPWHGIRWILCKLGRSPIFPLGYARTSQQRQELANDIGEVGLTDSTLSMGKPYTWGSGQQWSDWFNSWSVLSPQRGV